MKNQTTKMNCQVPIIKLANALNEEFSVLTSWHIPSVLEVLSSNKHHELPQNIFNIGTIFKKGSSQSGVVENERLACALCSDETDFTRIMQLFDYLMRMIGLKYKSLPTSHESFIPGRVARISVNGKDIAYIGEISPLVLQNWELAIPVSVFELNLTDLFDLINKN